MKKKRESQELARIQVEKEIEMKTAGIDRFNLNNLRHTRSGRESDTTWNRILVKELVDPMAEAIDTYIEYYSKRRGRPNKALSYIIALPTRETAYIAIKCILDSLAKKEKLSSLCISIGQKIEDQDRFKELASNAPAYVDKVMLSLRQAKSQQYNHRKKVLSHIEDKLSVTSKDYEACVTKWNSWPKIDLQHIGAFLLDIFHKNITFNGNPVIEKRSSTVNSLTDVSIIPTEYMTEWIDRYKQAVECLEPAYAPCVVQPRDWTEPTSGGYHVEAISSTLPMVKCNKKVLKRLSKEQMPEVYDTLNNLQSVKWTVNEEILDTLQRVLENDLALGVPSIAEIPFPDAPIPPEYKEIRGEGLKKVLTEKEWASFVNWKKEKRVLYEMESKRKSDLFKIRRILGSAKQYRDFENVYFVYTLDFRGRIYCKSDTISPQGDDLQKALVTFSEGKPLGKDGYYWLAVHGAGVLGIDKVPFDDRVSAIEGMTDKIRDIVCDPFTFRDWATADKPWQFLSWCFEWSKLQEWIEEGNRKEDFISHIPVAMDGSCSGIQHYSAILRDPVGSAAVNLAPDTKPHDIYKDVAEVAKIKLESLLCETKDEYELKIINTLLDCFHGINRSITKKAVMTLPYGSTFKSCLSSIELYFAELQDKEDRAARSMGREPVKVIACSENSEDGLPSSSDCNTFLAKVVWASIGDVVVAAREGMKYIQDVASFVANRNKSLEWIAPTGFIVEQRELESVSTRVKTQLFGETFLRVRQPTNTILVRKMRSSSAPNFIHSMDATHLVRSVNSCFNSGMKDFAVIHDSFGTHACNVTEMRRILRHELVRMYSENDVLSSFKEHNESRLLEEIPIPVPERMGFYLDKILESEYCFA